MRQVPSSNVAETALKNHNSYFAWLCMQSGIEGPLARLFYETDFRWNSDIVDDENRAKEAKDLREQYAIYLIVGDDASGVITTDQWKVIDILKKSIIGPACVFEILVCLARDLDSMLNMDNEPKVKEYFARLMSNVGFDFYDEEDWDEDSGKVETYWRKLLDRVLDRTYLPDGEGGLFPLDGADSGVDVDAVQRSLWDQMNDWADQEMEAQDDDF